MRIHGAGTVERRGKDVWRIRYTVNGRRTSKTIHGTKRDAQAALQEWISRTEYGVSSKASEASFIEYGERWLKRRSDNEELAYSTMTAYKLSLSELRDMFGDISISDLTPPVIRDTYDRYREQMTPLKLFQVHRLGVQISRAAMRESVMDRNPFDGVEPPRRPPSKEKDVLTVDEAARLLDILETGPLNGRTVAVRLALVTGMRAGEVCGLKWGDVNLEDGMISVKRQCDQLGELKKPKTASSLRDIYIDSDTVSHLKRWKEEQARYFARLSVAQTDAAPIVNTDSCGHVKPNNLGHWFRFFCVDNGFGRFLKTDDGKRKYSGFTFHGLRHTHATLLIADGVDVKTVQTRLGHTSASITLNLYTHRDMNNDRAAAGRIGNILNKENAGPGKVVGL